MAAATVPWLRPRAARRFLRAAAARHESVLVDPFVATLREHDVALVVADAAQRCPLVEDATSDHIYIRLHVSKRCARAVIRYFVNDAEVHAPFDAQRLIQRPRSTR